MGNNFKMRAARTSWTYRCSMGENPFVFFSSPMSGTNIIYSMDELKAIIARPEKENNFIYIPMDVIQDAIDELDAQLVMAA